VSTAKQRIAQQYNWRTAQIRGATAVLKHIAESLGFSGTANAVRDIGLKLEKANKEKSENLRSVVS
jgi:hypothetical protein